jgi:LmbE family N-acetylglucosaminyl deacetylase
MGVTSNLEGLARAGAPGDESSPKCALVIAAHPDDADFGAAGTAHLWSRQGWEFYYLVCTDGSKGSDDASLKPTDLVRLRREEQRDAARLLGVKDVFFLNNVDGELSANRPFLGEVVRFIRQLRPYAVFTHDPEAVIVRDSFVNHSDHRATGLTAIDAVYPAARDRLNFPEQIEQGLAPHKVREVYIWGSEKANFEVDITAVIETKAQALLLHKTQFEEDFVRRALEIWKSPEGRYVETFYRVQLWA